MMLPWIRPPTWSKIFKSQLVRSIERYSYIYKYALGGILILLLLDAIREVRKYSSVDGHIDLASQAGPQADALIHMRLFRAQRNLYISGFAVFLTLVIRRMITLVINEARLMASADASMRQAHSATAAAKQMMDNDPKMGGKGKMPVVAENEEKTKNTISELQQKIKFAEEDRDAIKEQATELKQEYDTLMDQYARLEKVLKQTSDLNKDK